MTLDSAVDRLLVFGEWLNTPVLSLDNVRWHGENATGTIAHFSSPLALLFLVAGGGHASSSRLAREPEKCTLAPVQLPNLGS
jgi:hypothetical protein